MRGSYTVVRSIDGYLSQVTRLAGRGYYFYFAGCLKDGKEPERLDAKLIAKWKLDQPYWKREKRRRGAAPSIWYLRYEQHYLLLATHGRQDSGEPHEFFSEYESCLRDIRRYALYTFGYSIRYPRSKETGTHRAFVRLDKATYLDLKERMCEKAVRERYRERDAFEELFRRLPYQPYREVGRQLRTIVKEANKRRSRYRGFEQARLSCVRQRLRPVKIYEYADDDYLLK